jgi:hypothetical protein
MASAGLILGQPRTMPPPLGVLPAACVHASSFQTGKGTPICGDVRQRAPRIPLRPWPAGPRSEPPVETCEVAFVSPPMRWPRKATRNGSPCPLRNCSAPDQLKAIRGCRAGEGNPRSRRSDAGPLIDIDGASYPAKALTHARHRQVSPMMAAEELGHAAAQGGAK